jgi:hypothetical protein
MSRLLIQSGPQHGTEIQLRPGLNRVGRHADNDIQIADPSVSGRHCELTPEAGGLHVRDLGSTNGTFVGGDPVQDVVLQPGQRLQLGGVELLFEPGAQVHAPPEVVSPPTLPSGVSPCHNHPQAPAEWLCNRCHNLFCTGCAIPRTLGAKTVHFCPRCGGQCVAFGLGPLLKAPEERPSFFRLLPQAFTYPLQGNGLAVIIGGGVFFAFLDFLQRRLPFIFLFGLIIPVIQWGYLFAFLENVITSSASGPEAQASWPEFSDWWSDIFSPLLRWLAVILLCLGPAAYFLGQASLAALMAGASPATTLLAGVACGIVGALYLPMALLAVAMAGSIVGLNPFVVIPSMLRLPLQYATACALMLVALVLEVVAARVVTLLPIPILPSVVAWCLFLYCMVAEMRLLGLLYYAHEEDLGWFSHRSKTR